MIQLDIIREAAPDVAEAMLNELLRQRRNIELIASENFVSPAVMAAMGSHLTNKYAEGYPDKRYYGGCEYVDVVENIARDRACQLFGAEHANVQPHSGAQANMAVFFAAPTSRYTSRCFSPVIRCWAWIFPTAATLPTEAPSICPVNTIPSIPTASIPRRSA